MTQKEIKMLNTIMQKISHLHEITRDQRAAERLVAAYKMLQTVAPGLVD